MSTYHFEKAMLETLIYGLKRLYNFLAEKEIKKELLGGHSSEKVVDDEENKQRIGVLQSLRDIFILKQKEERARRLQVNSSFPLFKLPNHIFIKYILCCLDLKDVCKLSLVCVQFNQMVKSNIFLLQYVKTQERTNIKVNLTAFGGSAKKLVSYKEEQKKSMQEEAKDDPETQIETQRRTKSFLSAKLQESDEKATILRNDIAVMKSLLEFEKVTKEEAIEQTGKLEAEFKRVKEELEIKEQDLSQRVSDLEAHLRGKTSEYEQIKEEVEKLKAVRLKLKETHKKLGKKIEDLKEKNEAKDKIINELVDRFEKGAAISTKLDASLSKSFSRDESGSIAGTDESTIIGKSSKK